MVIWKSDFRRFFIIFLPSCAVLFVSRNLLSVCPSDVDEGYLRLSPSFLVSFSCSVCRKSKKKPGTPCPMDSQIHNTTNEIPPSAPPPVLTLHLGICVLAF